MQIALYRGTSLVSRLIRFATRSPYSHAAFLFDTQSQAVAARLMFRRLKCTRAGAVVEAWQGGVKNSASLSTLHTPGTAVDVLGFLAPLTALEEARLLQMLDEDIGLPYDYGDIVRFLTRTRGHPDGSVFCSFEVFRRCRDLGRPLLARTEGWRVPPDWLYRSLALGFKRLEHTT